MVGTYIKQIENKPASMKVETKTSYGYVAPLSSIKTSAPTLASQKTPVNAPKSTTYKAPYNGASFGDIIKNAATKENVAASQGTINGRAVSYVNIDTGQPRSAPAEKGLSSSSSVMDFINYPSTPVQKTIQNVIKSSIPAYQYITQPKTNEVIKAEKEIRTTIEKSTIEKIKEFFSGGYSVPQVEEQSSNFWQENKWFILGASLGLIAVAVLFKKK
jgi:hypothetical protein